MTWLKRVWERRKVRREVVEVFNIQRGGTYWVVIPMHFVYWVARGGPYGSN